MALKDTSGSDRRHKEPITALQGLTLQYEVSSLCVSLQCDRDRLVRVTMIDMKQSG